MAETALVRMLLTARVEIDRHGMVRVVRPRPRDEVEAVLLAAVALTRRTPPSADPYTRPADGVVPLLAALRAGEPLPPGWHLPEDAPTPTGRTSWAALAATGVEALGRPRLTVAFHGRPVTPAPRRLR
ncbi:hypothetical protein ABT093_18865 [Kitasatospora sp. NPDC002551]|uniref:hypothetical protein n=1 Tax=Kitasatospora sp. NPDC002551 TaxID=3154539 RepID=UPI00332BBE75